MGGYEHYIRTDSKGIIIYGYTTGFEDPQPGDSRIIEDGPRHFQYNLVNDRGQFLYKVADGKMVLRDQAELDAEYNARPPAPKTEVQVLQDQNAEMNLQIIDLFEQLLTKGVL